MNKNTDKSGVVAIIPIKSSDLYDAQGRDILLLGRPLWEYTIAFARQSRLLDQIFIACDEQSLADIICSKEDLTPFIRPKWLSASDKTSFDVLKYVVENIQEASRTFCRVLYMEITHPIRSAGLLDNMIRESKKQDLDILFTAYEDPYNFWYRDQEGNFFNIETKTGPLKFPMFKEMLGVCTIFKISNILKNDFFGKRTAIVPIHDVWGMIDLREGKNLWMAEAFLKMERNK